MGRRFRRFTPMNTEKIWCSVIFVVLLSSTVFGQSFDVVSVKPATPGGGDSVLHFEPGRVHCRCLLNQLVQSAYDMRLTRVAVGQGLQWLLDPSISMNSMNGPFVYELDARFPAGTGTAQVSAMMRQMLADRFHLSAHRETRDDAVYILSVAPGGLKLEARPPSPPADPSAPPVRQSLIGAESRTGALHVHGAMSLGKLAFFLSNQMDREVIDMTGREGEFDIFMDARIPTMRAPLPGSILQRQDPGAVPDGLGSIFSEIRTPGLRLEPGRAPVEHLVIDSVERVPTPN